MKKPMWVVMAMLLIGATGYSVTLKQVLKSRGINTSAVSVSASGMKVTKIDGLKGFRKMTTLDLSGNTIRKIEGLGDLASLETLSLRNNKITKLEGLEKCVSLHRLIVSGNPLKSITRSCYDFLISQGVIMMADDVKMTFEDWYAVWNLKIVEK